MTNADRIRQMTDNELVDLLVWGYTSALGDVPDCSDECEYFNGGCANNCPHDKREKSVREWLRKEYGE